MVAGVVTLGWAEGNAIEELPASAGITEIELDVVTVPETHGGGEKKERGDCEKFHLAPHHGKDFKLNNAISQIGFIVGL